MSYKKPNAYTKDDIDRLLDAAGASKTSQLREKTSFSDVVEILCRVNGMALIDCMPQTNLGSGEPFTAGAFRNILLPSVLPNYKLTNEQIETIGRMFTPEKARARNDYLDGKGQRADCEKHARALKDVYDIEIPAREVKPHAARPQGRVNPVSRKDREIFSYIRADLELEGVKGQSSLFPKDMKLRDWVEVLLEQTGKSFADVVAGTDDGVKIKSLDKLKNLNEFEFETVAANLAAMVVAFEGGVPALQKSFHDKMAASSAGVVPNV